MSVRWYFNLKKWSPTYQEIALATQCVQQEEKHRLGKFYFNKDFKSSLIGRLMMRKYVSETCGANYDKVTFMRDERGKPIMENEYNVSFNVSHQGDYTVLVGEVGKLLLGVDIMKLEYSGGKPLKDFFRIMNRNFSICEWKQIYATLDEKQQLGTFCRLWSLKESYVKAVGVGITVNLQEISFKLNSPLKKDFYVKDTELFVQGLKLVEWNFEELLLDDLHCIAVAMNGKVGEKEFEELNFGILMENAKGFLEMDEGYCLEYFKKPEKPF